MKSEIIPIFPIPIGRVKLRSPSPDEWRVINHELETTVVPNFTNKITDDSYFLDTPGLENLKKDITEAINLHYVTTYRPMVIPKLYITTSWCNVSHRGDSHHAHIHDNSLLSGTYYLNTKNDALNFIRKSEDKLILMTPSKERNPVFDFEYNLNVNNFDVVLFPSNIGHFVKPVEWDGPRVSLSFNTFASGQFGDSRILTQITIPGV